jgi:hypothetical protein
MYKDNIGRSAGAKHVAKMLGVNGGLTRVDIRRNSIAGDGAEQLAAAVLGNLKIEMFNEIPIKEMRADSLTELDLKGKVVGVEGGMVVAGLMPVMGGLTKLSLAENKLEEEGTKAICEALEQNTTLKELDISGGYEGNIGGTAGAKHVAKMLGVNGGLTVANLLRNQLDAEAAKMLAEVAKQKGISLCGIQRDQTTANFSNQNLKLPDAILLASDLSQAVVTGGLTRIDLSGNQLCGIWTDGHGNQQGAYTAEGITAIADALRVNSALTKIE